MTKPSIQHVNPKGLIVNPAFTQMVIVHGPVKTIHIGAQNAVDGDGKIVGKGDIAAQTEQILKNIEVCLKAAGAARDDIISWSIYVAEGQDLMSAAQTGIKWWGGRPNPPLNNVMFVSGFMPSDFLISIEATAVVPVAE
ncbi:MAG TPA: RidA family protein [Candidatus Dormibacteraeota bacterium]|nr:RidA family protein [Candidatus Dormibacteraeota bacterium]